MTRPPAPPSPLTDTTVLRYLRQHPDLFARHPDMVARLHIPHGSAGTVSLVEHQLAVLREQLQHERQRQRQLISHAHAYERLQRQLHRVTLSFIAARNMTDACQQLDCALRREFHTDAVAIKLFPALTNADPDPIQHSFDTFIHAGQCRCGALAPEHSQLLFGADGAQFQSGALIPLRAAGISGVLAIGSHDVTRFTPDLATDVLARLGEIVSAKLAEYAADSAVVTDTH